MGAKDAAVAGSARVTLRTGTGWLEAGDKPVEWCQLRTFGRLTHAAGAGSIGKYQI